MIEGDRLKLVSLEPKHFDNTLRWINDPSVAIGLGRAVPTTMHQHQRWYEAMLADRTQVAFAIETKEGEHVGNCGLDSIDCVCRKAHHWFYVDPSQRGKRYGVEATRLLVAYGFKFLNLNRITANPHDNNIASQKTSAAAGFLVEGLLRQNVFIDGEYHDTIPMAILRQDYEETQ